MPGSEIEEAADKDIGRNELAGAVVALVVQTNQRLGVLPAALASLAVGDGDDGVAIVVALHVPLEAEGLQGRGLDHELVHRDTVGRRSCRVYPRRAKETGNGEARGAQTPDPIAVCVFFH